MEKRKIKEIAMYSYGILEFSPCYNTHTRTFENDLLIMFYGCEKKLVFPKCKAFELICAINGDENFANSSKFDREFFDFEIKKLGLVGALNFHLKGKGFIMVTEFKNKVEYINGIQNNVVGLTGLDLDCKVIAKSKQELFTDCIANYDVDIYDRPPQKLIEKHVFEA